MRKVYGEVLSHAFDSVIFVALTFDEFFRRRRHHHHQISHVVVAISNYVNKSDYLRSISYSLTDTFHIDAIFSFYFC